MNSRVSWISPECRGPANNLWTSVLETSQQQQQTQNQSLSDDDLQKTTNITDDETSILHSDMDDGQKIFKSIKSRDNIASTIGINHSRFAHHLQMNSDRPLTPWIKKNKKYQPGILGLHEEILDFNAYMKPTLAEHRMRQEVIDRITKSVANIWAPDHVKVEVFGSFKTELYLPTSDIDLVVFGDWETPPLRRLRNQLVQDGVCLDSDVKELSRATVPIVKLTDKITNVTVDISFNMKNSVKSAELIRRYMKRMPHLSFLAFVLKQFLLQRDLNEVFCGGISSYSLILLTISFLQLHPRYDARISSVHLGLLLVEFFELYGRNFNYFKTAITIRDRGAYRPKSELSLDNSGILCIEDPLEPTNDIGRSSYGVMQVKQAFDDAYITLTNGHFLQMSGEDLGNGLLSRIIRITDEVVEYRNWVNSTFDPNILPLQLATPYHLNYILTPKHQQFQDISSSDGGSPPNSNGDLSRSNSPTTSGFGSEKSFVRRKEQPVIVSVGVSTNSKTTETDTSLQNNNNNTSTTISTSPTNKRDTNQKQFVISQTWKPSPTMNNNNNKSRSNSSTGIVRRSKQRATTANGRTSR